MSLWREDTSIVRDVGQAEYLLDSDVPAPNPVITPHLSA